MIRIEPKQLEFLEAQPKSLQCKLPPLENYVELVNMVYFKPAITYKTFYYNLECQIVASGEMMYHDFLHSTEVKTFHIVKTSNGHYFILNIKEWRKYAVEVDGTEAKA